MPTYPLALICACLILSGCHKTAYVDKRVPVLPPAQYLDHCPTDYGSRSLAEVVTGLSDAVRCERADKDAIRSWADEYRGSSGQR